MKLHEEQFVNADTGDIVIQTRHKERIYIVQTNGQTITINRELLPVLIKRLKKEIPKKWYQRPWWVWAITISALSIYFVKLFMFLQCQ